MKLRKLIFALSKKFAFGKLSTIILILFLVSKISAQMMVMDPAAQADRQKDFALKKAHNKIMATNVVQTFQMIKQNYDEGVKYRAWMKKVRDHKGGVMGYYKDKTIGRFQGAHTELLDKLEKSFNTEQTQKEKEKIGEGKYISYWGNKLDDIVYEKTDLETILKKKAEKRKKDLEIMKGESEKVKELEEAQIKLSEDAGKLKTQDDYDKWHIKKGVLELEYLRCLYSRWNRERLQKEAERIDFEQSEKTISDMYRASMLNLNKSIIVGRDRRQQKDPLKELKRIPDQSRNSY